MTQIGKIASALVVLVLFFAANAHGQEKHIKKSDLPPAVQKTAEEQSAGATIRGYTQETENGKLEYEVEMTVNGHSKDVSIDASGNVLEVEESATLDALPVAVRQGLQKKAGGGKIVRVESITKQGKVVAYEAHILTGTKRSEAQVGPDGTPLDHEE
jgi:biopolymer transport protein ExbD